jgi:aminoglycoside N3'-acetyltransferase
MSEAHTRITRESLVTGLRNIGLQAGDNVVVHSSLSRLGRVEGGTDTVIDALEEVVTADGTLLMPTFSSRTIYFLEALALDRGINGSGTGKGEVFVGTVRELYDAAMPFSEQVEPGWRFPFASPMDFWNLIAPERHAKYGWTIIAYSDQATEETSIRLFRDAPPRSADDTVPWRMPVWTGAIPARLAERPEGRRSHQYSGSFTAWGRLTEHVIGDHTNRPGQRLHEHPLHRMCKANGRILLLGVDHRSNSTIHIAQQVALEERKLKLLEGGTEYVGSFQHVDKPLEFIGGQIRGRIGNATVRLADTKTLYRIVDGILDERISTGLAVAA